MGSWPKVLVAALAGSVELVEWGGLGGQVAVLAALEPAALGVRGLPPSFPTCQNLPSFLAHRLSPGSFTRTGGGNGGDGGDGGDSGDGGSGTI